MEESQHIRVKLFANLIEHAGTVEFTMPLCADTGSLQMELCRLHPGLQHTKFAIAVNRKIAGGNQPLHAGDEVALLPPFSGG